MNVHKSQMLSVHCEVQVIYANEIKGRNAQSCFCAAVIVKKSRSVIL